MWFLTGMTVARVSGCKIWLRFVLHGFIIHPRKKKKKKKKFVYKMELAELDLACNLLQSIGAVH